MTPKEKAIEMIKAFRDKIYEGQLTTANVDLKREAFRDEQGKRCALLAIDITLASCMGMYNEFYPHGQYFHETKWSKELDEIKQEIEKL